MKRKRIILVNEQKRNFHFVNLFDALTISSSETYTHTLTRSTQDIKYLLFKNGKHDANKQNRRKKNRSILRLRKICLSHFIAFNTFSYKRKNKRKIQHIK